MKISYNWLKQYTEELPGPEELSVMLTNCGLEVEALEKYQSVPGGLEGIYIGEVRTCERHPNADKLSVTTVAAGTGSDLSIVCGAPNVAAGQKVLVAVPGATLDTPKGRITLEKTKIRGVFSEGMICAEDETGLGTSHEGIMVLPPDAPVGMPAKDYFRVEQDFVFEIGLTPNRSDAASHIGVARDILAVINLQRHENKLPPLSLKMPDISTFSDQEKPAEIPVIIEDEGACPRYSGLTITGVQFGESPDWLRHRLEAIDVRPINNIVDITQYVLFETGQPLHAFDAEAISGGKVMVKKLPEGTKFTTLDGVERMLSKEDLMICNADEGMCMAGVFGGEKSGVSGQTTRIFLESACFHPATIRKTSKRHGLKTDASFRFERGSDINMTLYALKRAALLISEIAGGVVSSALTDVCPGETQRKKVHITYAGLNRIAGQTIEAEVVRNILTSLDIAVEKEDAEGMLLAIPTAKVDVTRDVDVFEEILRIYGYDNIRIPDMLRTGLSAHHDVDRETYRNALSDFLTANGFYEIMTNSLTHSAYTEKYADAFDPAKNVSVQNPVSRELNVMRQTLLFGGLESVVYNQNHKNPDVRFYEFGTVYQLDGAEKEPGLNRYREHMELALYITGNRSPENWREKAVTSDFFLLKSFVERIFGRMGITASALAMKADISPVFDEQLHWYSGERWLCSVGVPARNIITGFDLRDDVYYAHFDWDLLVMLASQQNIVYREVPKFPEVRRDLALLIDETVTYEEIETVAWETETRFLKKLNLFDVYTDEKMGEKKSYALSFVLQDEEKTLTDKEIDGVMKRLSEAFSTKLGAVLR